MSQSEPPPKPGIPPQRDPSEFGVEENKEYRTLAMLAHLTGLLTWFWGPLIIYLLKKDESPFVADQAKEALNFQIVMTIAHLICGVLWSVCVGVIGTAVLAVLQIVFGIMGTLKAYNGEYYRYPLNIPLIK